jgi:hypothetical protein
MSGFLPLLFLVIAFAADANAQQAVYETRTLTTITNKEPGCSHNHPNATCLLANIAQATASASLVSGAVVAKLESPGGGYIAAPEVVVSGVTCSEPPHLTAAIRHSPPLGKLPISAAGGWGIVTGFAGSGGSQCTGTPIVAIAPPGPGNMTRLRFSVSPPGATSNRWVCDSSIQFIVDGTALTSLPLGILFNTYATAGFCGGAPTHVGTTPRLQVTMLSGGFAGQISLMIPFKRSLQVNYIPDELASGTGLLWSQVDYYTGAIPAGVYPPTDGSFHVHLIPLGTNVTAYSNIDLLPVVRGAGRLNSIQLFVQGSGEAPTWLEGILPVYLDGVPWAYNGTEDTFCGSYYFGSVAGFLNGPDSCGVTALGKFGSLYGTNMFRFFDSNPMIFEKSLQVSWANGMRGVGHNPGTVTIAALVTYYTSP